MAVKCDDVQMDLFAEIDAADAEIAREEYRVNGWRLERHGAPLQPILSDAEGHNAALWQRAEAEWRYEHGHFGIIPRCHVWRIPLTSPGTAGGMGRPDATAMD